MARRIPNGYARRHGCTAKDVDPEQLRIGTRVEMEHTSDREIARQIALDHICESRGARYYVPANVRHERLLLKRNSALGDSSCSHTSRVVRGGLGALIGGVLGSMIGGGIALAVTTTQADITAPIATFKLGRTMILVASGVTILGAVGGLAVGAAKPEC
jgi:hypothetical protein